MRVFKRSILLLFIAVCLWAQVSGGIRQTLWPAFPALRLPSFQTWMVPCSGLDFLLLYGMFSPNKHDNTQAVESLERAYSGGAFALQSRTEIWAELADGRFVRITGDDYIPDPRDEQVLLARKKLKGDRFPTPLRAKGETPETIYGREMLARYNQLNPGKNAVSIHTRMMKWPAGNTGSRQLHSGVEHYDFPSISELRREGAWARARLRRIWPPEQQ